jgi:hypothetical protein
MAGVLRARAAIYQDIIKVGGAENIEVVSQSVVNKTLKRRRGSSEPKGHHERLEQA